MFTAVPLCHRRPRNGGLSPLGILCRFPGQRRSRGDWSGSAPEFELNYGVLPNVHLHVITPLGFDVPPQGRSHYGLNDFELGVKFRFIQETNGQPQVGIYPMLMSPPATPRKISVTAGGMAFCRCGCKKAGDRGRSMAAAVTASIPLPRGMKIGALSAPCAKAGVAQRLRGRGGLLSIGPANRLSL